MIRLPRKTCLPLAQLKPSRAQFDGNNTYGDNKRSHRLPCVDELAESSTGNDSSDASFQPSVNSTVMNACIGF